MIPSFFYGHTFRLKINKKIIVYISNMDRDIVGEVYQITVLNKHLGDRPGFVWTVGKYYTVNGVRDRFVCSRLLHNENNFFFYGTDKWTVYLKDTKTGKEFAHVDYERASLEIKRDVPKEIL